MSETAKPLRKGAYDKQNVEVIAIERKTVIPYDDIKTALENGQIYVLAKAVSKNTVAQAKNRLKDKYGLTDIKLGKTKDTKQFVFYI